MGAVAPTAPKSLEVDIELMAREDDLRVSLSASRKNVSSMLSVMLRAPRAGAVENDNSGSNSNPGPVPSPRLRHHQDGSTLKFKMMMAGMEMTRTTTGRTMSGLDTIKLLMSLSPVTPGLTTGALPGRIRSGTSQQCYQDAGYDAHQHSEAAASSSSPHAEPAAKRRHRQDTAPAPEAVPLSFNNWRMHRFPDLRKLGLRQTTLQVFGLFEELTALGAPTHITSYQYGGHYKVKHTAFHMADVERVKRHMGFGNWTLSWAAHMMAPEIRTVFNSSKVLGDMVESWLVVAESQPTPPVWCDVFSLTISSLGGAMSSIALKGTSA